MNWFTKLFKPKPLSQSDRDFFDACHAFMNGEKIWKEATGESKLIKIKEALKYFDEAIKIGLVEPAVFSYGFKESEVFSLRAFCLNDLGFYFDALEDFNRALEKNPKKIANIYYMRSIVKDSICDFEGSVADLKEAIRLSKLDNADNRLLNDYTKQSLGYKSASEYYKFWLEMAEERIEREKIHPTDKDTKLKEIKRRNQ